MKKKLRIIAVLIVLVVVSVAADAQFFGRETDIAYYYDDTFATYIGEYDVDCDGNVYSWGSLGSWRIYDQYSCRTGNQVVHRCQQTDGMGGWINLACPF